MKFYILSIVILTSFAANAANSIYFKTADGTGITYDSSLHVVQQKGGVTFGKLVECDKSIVDADNRTYNWYENIAFKNNGGFSTATGAPEKSLQVVKYSANEFLVVGRRGILKFNSKCELTGDFELNKHVDLEYEEMWNWGVIDQYSPRHAIWYSLKRSNPIEGTIDSVKVFQDGSIELIGSFGNGASIIKVSANGTLNL